MSTSKQPEPRKVLDRLPADVKDALMAKGRQITIKKNALIFDVSETDACFLLDGYAALSRGSKYGKDKIIFICGPAEMLNELVLETDASSVKAQALTECSILKIDHQELLALAHQHQQLYDAIFRSLTGKTRKLYRQAGNDTGIYPLEKHLVIRIWKLARDFGHDTEMGRMIDFDVSVTMLSNMLGAQRESVSRVMSMLRKEHLITTEKKQLIVPDMEQLHDMY